MTKKSSLCVVQEIESQEPHHPVLTSRSVTFLVSMNDSQYKACHPSGPAIYKVLALNRKGKASATGSSPIIACILGEILCVNQHQEAPGVQITPISPSSLILEVLVDMSDSLKEITARL